jgi:hypothetical protein
MPRGEVPIEPFRARYEQLLKNGTSASEVARRMGFRASPTARVPGGADTQRLKRTLGLAPYYKRGKTYIGKGVTYETAVRLAEALEMDPAEAGV